ncbi:MAG: dTDP-4-dehydrorhamnose reductase, partial [Litorimonas sp.]
AEAHAINAEGPAKLGAACKAVGARLVHISTDYVFDGQGTEPYRTDMAVDPVNVYGRTKLAGEQAVRAAMLDASRPRWAILRTSWVYDGANKNFLTTMLRLSETRDALSVVDDQVGRPTSTVDLARAALRALEGVRDDPSLSGIYHVSNSGDPVSWAGFAREIFARAGRDVAVTPVPSTEYPTPAVRPAYSVMDVERFERSFGLDLPDWREALADVLRGHGDEPR